MNYTPTQEEIELITRVERAMNGEDAGSVPSIKEFTALPSAQVLIPKVIIGAVRRAAEPVYLGTKLLKTIRAKNAGQMYIFPTIGPIRAYDVGEGQEIPVEAIDWQTREGAVEVRIGKAGVRVQVTQELIDDSMWDIISLMLDEAGRAMARHKEQKVFGQFSKHGWTVFDNTIRTDHPEAGTTGLDKDGQFNDTMSIEDFLDMIIAVIANEFTPTDIILHPLTWSAFAKSHIAGMMTWGAQTYPGGPNMPSATAGAYNIGPDSIQGRIPFGLNVMVSPFVPFDKTSKRFDMYCVDHNNIGLILQRDDIKPEQFDDPARDIRNIKLVERYGVGILHQGRGVAVAKNISMETSYPEPLLIKNVGN
jgi:HK97 family phage major capsid protein